MLTITVSIRTLRRHKQPFTACCIIGEVTGLMIGITLGLAVWQIITLATILRTRLA